ncbi:MAG: methyltransferase [Cellulomonadaceae bacterium]|nr:methyltransferase [Cellulomonadaceae bacterium]
MGSDHYFTARPVSPDERQSLNLTLAGDDVTVETASGVFSSGHLDLGTRVLLDRVPDPPEHGVFLDLGCGWGPIAITLGKLAPNAQVWAVDTNERALELTRLNAERLGLDSVRASSPENVPPDLRFDLIWSNPPIRIGKSELHKLLLFWLNRLSDDGEAWLVVQRNLGADSLQEWLRQEIAPARQVTRAGSAKGFRLLRVHAADASTD